MAEDGWCHNVDYKIKFNDDNPHRNGTKLWDLFEKAKLAATVGQAKEKGASAWNLKEWREKERIILMGGSEGKGDQGVVADNGGDGGTKRKLEFRGADGGAEPTVLEKECRERSRKGSELGKYMENLFLMIKKKTSTK